jgi:anti-anti-sigma regulatory factor
MPKGYSFKYEEKEKRSIIYLEEDHFQDLPKYAQEIAKNNNITAFVLDFEEIKMFSSCEWRKVLEAYHPLKDTKKTLYICELHGQPAKVIDRMNIVKLPGIEIRPTLDDVAKELSQQ